MRCELCTTGEPAQYWIQLYGGLKVRVCERCFEREKEKMAAALEALKHPELINEKQK